MGHRWVPGQLLLAHRLQLTWVVGPAVGVAVDQAHTVDPGPERFGEGLVGPVHVGELCLASSLGHLDRVQHRAQAGHGSEGAVGVPAFGPSQEHRLGLVSLDHLAVGSHVAQVEDLGMIGMALLGLGQDLQLAERSTELDQVRRLDPQAPEHQDPVVDQALCQRRHHTGVGPGGRIEADHPGPEPAGPVGPTAVRSVDGLAVDRLESKVGRHPGSVAEPGRGPHPRRASSASACRGSRAELGRRPTRA